MRVCGGWRIEGGQETDTIKTRRVESRRSVAVVTANERTNNNKDTDKDLDVQTELKHQLFGRILLRHALSFTFDIVHCHTSNGPLGEGLFVYVGGRVHHRDDVRTGRRSRWMTTTTMDGEDEEEQIAASLQFYGREIMLSVLFHGSRTAAAAEC